MPWALSILLGCSDTERSVLTDEGSVCLNSTASGGLSVRVQFPQCLSSSCDRSISASCTINRSGASLTIHSESVVERQTKGDCTTDCRTVSATCALESLEAGEYTVVHGENEGSVQLPANAVVLFAGTSAFFAQPCE